MKRGLARAFLILMVCVMCSPASSQEPSPVSVPDTVPVPRPASAAASRSIPIQPFWHAEREFLAGRTEEALSLYLDLAYRYSDDERKGFVWMRVGEILLSRGELEPALSAVDKAILLSRARFLTLSAVDLKFRIYQRMQWRKEARQVAAYLLEQGYIHSDPPKLLAYMARADAEEGRIAQSMALYRRAASAAGTQEEAAKIRSERDSVIDGFQDILALKEAAEGEDEATVKGHLFLTMGKLALKKGFLGMGAFAFDRAAHSGGARGREAAEQLYRLEKITASRPRIVGLLPLSGQFADLGFAVLSGAEVALRMPRPGNGDAHAPVLRWVDTGGQPDRARREFIAAAADRNAIGVLGPLTGEEGSSVGAAFGPKSPPVLYLGQKGIPEKPFLYGFGLSPAHEARAVISHLRKNGHTNLLLLYPDNGYGKGFAEAVAAAAREAGIKEARSVSYPPDMKDFTEVIRKVAGASAFERDARAREKGKAMKLKQEAVIVADRWDRVFLIASQLRYYNVYLPMAGFSGWNDEELIRKAGDAVAGAVFSVDYADAIPGTHVDRFRADFRREMRSAPSRFEAMGYDGAMLLAEAYGLKDEKETRTAGEAVRGRIPRLKTFRGVTGTFQFGPAGEMRRKVFLMRVELGNFVPVPES